MLMAPPSDAMQHRRRSRQRQGLECVAERSLPLLPVGLDVRRTGIGVVQAVLAQDLFFLFGSERHETTPLKSVREG